jgi:hypothetical protein
LKKAIPVAYQAITLVREPLRIVSTRPVARAFELDEEWESWKKFQRTNQKRKREFFFFLKLLPALRRRNEAVISPASIKLISSSSSAS